MHVYYYCTDSVDIGPTAYDFLQTFSFAIHDGIQQRKLRIRCHPTETSLFLHFWTAARAVVFFLNLHLQGG